MSFVRLKMKRIEKEREEHGGQKLKWKVRHLNNSNLNRWQGSERVRRDYEKIFGHRIKKSRQSGENGREEEDEDEEQYDETRARCIFETNIFRFDIVRFTTTRELFKSVDSL